MMSTPCFFAARLIRPLLIISIEESKRMVAALWVDPVAGPFLAKRPIYRDDLEGAKALAAVMARFFEERNSANR